MQRDAAKAEQRPDPIRLAAGLPIGVEGEFFVGEEGFMGQGHGPDILDGNYPPTTQPGLWLKWAPNEEGTALEWNEGEKFNKYIQWLEYLLKNFLSPWGYKLKGKVSWQGESDDDVGYIIIYNNRIFVNEDPVLDKLVAEL